MKMPLRHAFSPLLLAVLIGAALGAAIGYIGQCTTGTCPLTSTWWRGALLGGVFGLLFGLSSNSKRQTREDSKSPSAVEADSPQVEDTNAMKTLMILTSHDKLGDTGKKTGFWLEEFAAPYYVLLDAGAEITLASPAGGQPPLDPQSDLPDAQTKATQRFKTDVAAQRALANTAKLAEIDADGCDAVFFPGGHGPLWDLAENEDSQRIIETLIAADRPVAAVCHAPAIFKHTKGADGKPLVSGRRVTGFSNTEEAGVGLAKIVPFLVEDMLKENGGLYEKGPDWGSHVVVDGNLVTGQNPASSEAAAKELLKLL